MRTRALFLRSLPFVSVIVRFPQLIIGICAVLTGSAGKQVPYYRVDTDINITKSVIIAIAIKII